MPLRPHLSARHLRSILSTSAHRSAPASLPPCLRQRPYYRSPQTSSRHAFHTSRPLRDSASTSTHYETLNISITATQQEIKRQYFTLSKKYHPDHNPDDPTASSHFVKISEAYHVLGVPDKRAQYDMQLGESSHGRARGPSYGSYSSHQTYAGSRPASGLNKKRSTFRGPPPSFYKSGGYGRHGAKRAEYANQNPHPRTEQSNEAGPESYGDFGSGFGPGQQAQGHEVPHFDDVRHKRTHEQVHEHIQARRRKRRKFEVPEDFDPRSSFSSFLMIAGALTTIGLLAKGLQVRFGDQPNAGNSRETR